MYTILQVVVSPSKSFTSPTTDLHVIASDLRRTAERGLMLERDK